MLTQISELYEKRLYILVTKMLVFFGVSYEPKIQLSLIEFANRLYYKNEIKKPYFQLSKIDALGFKLVRLQNHKPQHSKLIQQFVISILRHNSEIDYVDFGFTSVQT